MTPGRTIAGPSPVYYYGRPLPQEGVSVIMIPFSSSRDERCNLLRSGGASLVLTSPLRWGCR